MMLGAGERFFSVAIVTRKIVAETDDAKMLPIQQCPNSAQRLARRAAGICTPPHFGSAFQAWLLLLLILPKNDGAVHRI